MKLIACLVTVLVVLLALVGHAAPVGSGETGSVTFEYVAHACFRILSPAGNSVMVDPYESRWWLGYDFPRGLAATDAVLISHPHSDHDGGRAAGHELPWAPDTRVLTDPGSYEVGDIKVIGIRGKHADPYGKEFGQTNTIWLLEIDGLRIVHVGDNGPITDSIVEQAGRVDILFLPVDSEYHILAHDEIEAYRSRLAPSVLIPMHYRHSDLESDPDSPDDLGGIDGWLKGRENVLRLDSHIRQIDRGALPDGPQILVFEHSPAVRPPS